MSPKRSFDKSFAIIVTVLVTLGFLFFLSASLGLLAKEEGARFSPIFFSQFVFGLGLGLVALFTLSKIHYRKYKKYTFYIFLASLVMSLLVFVPGLGFEHNAAYRWLNIFGFSFQPAEFLKLAFILYFAALLTSFKNKPNDWKYNVLPIMILLSVVSVISYIQPDYGTFVVIAVTAMAMFFISGVRLKYFFITLAVAIVGIIPIICTKSYILTRLLTFFNGGDALGSGYQIKQSLIAIGSGGFFGKGFGKSVQKFGSLPESIGDSIFAVTAEEWGFIGASLLVALFFFFTYRGLKISHHSVDIFGRLLVAGLVILIASQSFINMASMLGIFPMIGMPLLFISKGGTALFFTLAEVGIILNVSKYQKLTK